MSSEGIRTGIRSLFCKYTRCLDRFNISYTVREQLLPNPNPKYGFNTMYYIFWEKSHE